MYRESHLKRSLEFKNMNVLIFYFDYRLQSFFSIILVIEALLNLDLLPLSCKLNHATAIRSLLIDDARC